MFTLNLNGSWKMKKTTDSKWIDAKVPGSIFDDLLNAGEIEDPFYRENELQAIKVYSYDYEYQREFCVTEELLGCDKVMLCCEGLDTLVEIKLNGNLVGHSENMHRTYEFDIKKLLVEGNNIINITIYSPLKYIAEKQKQHPTWGTDNAIEGFQHIRKAHYMFGWDWGPKIPDAGIWRNIYIKGYDIARLEDVYIKQHHQDGRVSLDVRVRVDRWKMDDVDIGVKITAPSGEEYAAQLRSSSYENHLEITIKNPELWWPNGYGNQPLYRVETIIKCQDVLLDSIKFNIGLRTLRVKRENDQWGESFEFEVNGVSIFAMGANYIPEDSLLARCTPERTEKLIRYCKEANFNCIRVWGGGIYPWDYFYDLCDKYGLIVWQDLMFACAVYAMTDEFAENIKKEALDIIKRIRHHACLGILCGNNEVEVAWAEWDFPKTEKLRADYIKQFEVLLKDAAKESAPDILYWPSSPSSGGGFKDPNNENMGDVHYWEVWHGLKPFTEYRNYYFRFVSEFGFQSFPCLKTVETFTLPEDRNIFSPVMENHQKNVAANGKILFYLSSTFKYPYDFDTLLYTSQILQAEAIRYGVEHWRRNRGRCMGAIYWQLNDCWPVASWSSIDYYGRWKALHYYARRFFAPVLLSACEEGKTVALHVSNEMMEPFKGTVIWALRNNKSQVLKEGSVDVTIPALSSCLVEKLDFSTELSDTKALRSTYLEYKLKTDGCDGCTESMGTVLFVPPKHFEFIKPEIRTEVSENDQEFLITVSSNTFAKYVELDLRNADCIFSDNYFDISAGDIKTVKVKKEDISEKLSLDEFSAMLMIRSLY